MILFHRQKHMPFKNKIFISWSSLVSTHHIHVFMDLILTWVFCSFTDRFWENLHHGDRLWRQSPGEWGGDHSQGRGSPVPRDRGVQEESHGKQHPSPWFQSQCTVYRGQSASNGHVYLQKLKQQKTKTINVILFL